MRLKCEVNITNRLLPTLNICKPARATFTQVSIGRKPGDKNKSGQVFLMLCTAQNRNGTKYLLHRNVVQIFGKFIHEGKATVRFLNPADDIAFSKADPKQLLMFTKLLRLACYGNEVPADALSTLVPASSEQIVKPVTSLQVNSPSDYPMTFPKSLQELTIRNCSLRKISPQITALPELRSLDMSLNSLSSVPDSLGQLARIHTLNLSGNKLTAFPAILCSAEISKCLANLDLRNNEISSIPTNIVMLKSLHSLNVSHNHLKHIPESLAFMKMLRNIFMSDNQLAFLPGTLLTRMFETADFSNNPFPDQPLVDRKQAIFPVPKLSEVSARIIVTHRIPYTVEDLDWLSIGYLKTVRFCVCGKPCFEAKVTQFLKMKVPSNICYGQGQVPFLINFCSRGCSSRFH